jgi:hypothetical protein
MPAFGFVLVLLGLWVLIRTIRGGLVAKIAPNL